jgi:hypothetical protein
MQKRKTLYLAATAILVAAFGYETYRSSGWAGFRLSQHLPWAKPPVTTSPPSGDDKNNLPSITDAIQCDVAATDTATAEGKKPELSIWFAPFRRFPEWPAEGDHRGRGDYEYFAYVLNRGCQDIAVNYGAFKNSEADRRFEETSADGLRAELLLAKELGYDLFVLDTRKVWLSAADREDCVINQPDCTPTGDGFLIVRLKPDSQLADTENFLLTSARFGIGNNLSAAVERFSANQAPASDWHGWETPSESTAFRWNNGSDDHDQAVIMPFPVVGDSLPSNLSIRLQTSPSIKSLTIELLCTRGSSSTVALLVEGRRDITDEIRSCHPSQLKTLEAKGPDGRPHVGAAPRLTDQDPRRSFYAVEYQLTLPR